MHACGAAQRGVFDEEYVVEAVLDVRGPPDVRFYKVEWEGDWGEDKVGWEPSRHLSANMRDDFWAAHPELDGSKCYEVEGEYRCKWCCAFYDSEKDLHSHLHGKKGCDQRIKSRAKQSKSRKVVEKMLRAEKQVELERVRIGEKEVESVFDFPYLGYTTTVDGDPAHPIEIRRAKASARFKELHNLWRSTSIGLKTKVQLYISGVCSVLTHSPEVWLLNDHNSKMLRKWNARCLSFITGRPIRDEYKRTTYDLVAHLRVHRLRWLGHVLRMDESRDVKKVVTQSTKPYPQGSLLMDTPKHQSMEELERMANDREDWNVEVLALSKRLA